MPSQYHNNNPHDRVTTAAVDGLMRTWVYSVAVIAGTILVSMAVKTPWWIPALTFAEAFVFRVYRANINRDENLVVKCERFPGMVHDVLMWSGIVMTVICLLYMPWFFGGPLGTMFRGVKPIITSLVVFPVSIVVCIHSLIMGRDVTTCVKCRQKFGYYNGKDDIAVFYFNESRFQTKLLLWLSIGLGLLGYIYYGYFYDNMTFTRADRYIFELVPLITFGLSVIYLHRRCMTLKYLLKQRDSHPEGADTETVIRYLVFSGDRLLLTPSKDGRFDTPYKTAIHRRSEVDVDVARKNFDRVAPDRLCNGAEFKYIYRNDGFASGANVFHYAVFVSDLIGEVSPDDDGIWMSVDMLDRLISSRMIKPMLANELYRIYTITMAWKTYDREGRRRYPIKHYRPTFRLRDFKEWNVDYDDTNWIDTWTTNNEDRRFYKFRKIWGKVFLRRT